MFSKYLKRTLWASCGFATLLCSAAHAQTFNIVDEGDFGNSHRNFPASNATDGNTGFRSRWAATFAGGDANLYVDLGSVQRIDDVGIAWGRGDGRSYRFEIRARSRTRGSWERVFSGTSSGRSNGIEQYNVRDVDARQVRVKIFSASDGSRYANITEFEVYGTRGPSGRNSSNNNSASNNNNSNNNTNNNNNNNNNNASNNNSGSGQFGLNPNAEPWENFDLSDWVIDTPAFASDGESQRFGERDWDDISNDSRRFFFTHTDGGMRFVTRLDGARTSSGTSFVRSELREMLRRGNRSVSTTGVTANNWALGYQPRNNRIGARNGRLTATLRVNKVTTSGNGIHVGRTIIGQIHADNDEPLRLYYRKEPGDRHGCIYASHEIRDGNDVDFDIIGEEDCNNPSNGIELNELFSYEIINDDEDIIVRIRRGDRNGPVIGQTTIDMDRLNSGYDRSDEWMYFKLGAYTQNNTGRGNDGDIITFYRLSNTHD